MSAMFMEDDEMPGTDVDDVRTRMRAALRANQVRNSSAFMDAVRKTVRALVTPKTWTVAPTNFKKEKLVLFR